MTLNHFPPSSFPYGNIIIFPLKVIDRYIIINNFLEKVKTNINIIFFVSVSNKVIVETMAIDIPFFLAYVEKANNFNLRGRNNVHIL